MRNFKKILSLVLCMAMMLSVMVVGAGAAFSDQSKIKNTEAVDACATLNIINGYTDGSFKPEGTITRAEACKMICIALNGGKEPVLGTNATATFTDIKGHWAEGYIEYCVSEGIVAGIGGGKFAPNATVTGSQFAKMLLIALGYRADHENFLGNAWEVNVNVKASAKGLYEDLAGMDPSVALTRDNAAQMVWNALQAKEVGYDYTLVTENGQLTSKVTVNDKAITLLKDKYNSDIETGIVTAVGHNSKGYTASINLGAQKSLDLTKMDNDPTEFVGKAVKVMYKATDDVYGIYVDADNTAVVVETSLGDIDLNKDEYKLDGVTYDTKVANFGAIPAVTAIGGDKIGFTAIADLDDVAEAGVSSAAKVVLIDNTGDEEIDIAVVTPVEFGEVSYLGADKITVKTGILTNVDKDECELYDGIAKEDFVAVVKGAYVADGDNVITKLDMVSGKIDAYKGTDEVRVDSAWYTSLVSGLAGSSAVDTEGDFYLFNGYIVMKDAKSGSISDTAYVIKVGSAFDVDGNHQVKVMINGETKIVNAEVNTVDSTITTSTVDTYCTYDIDDGVYQFKPVTQNNVPTDFAYATVESYKDKKLYSADDAAGTAYIVDADAVIYVKYKTDKYEIVSGKDVAAWGDKVKDLTGTILTKQDNGMTVVKGGALDMGANSIPTATTTYGVITSSIVTNKDNEKEFTIWNGSEYIDVVSKTTADLAKFDLVEYQKNADDTYDITLIREGDVDRLSIIGWNENTGDIKLKDNSTTYDRVVDEDTLVIFVNTDKDVDAREAGILGEAIDVSAQPDGTNYNKNAISYTNTDGDLEVLVIDTVNNTYAK